MLIIKNLQHTRRKEILHVGRPSRELGIIAGNSFVLAAKIPTHRSSEKHWRLAQTGNLRLSQTHWISFGNKSQVGSFEKQFF